MDEPFLDKFIRKVKKDPLVFGGVCVTVGFLLNGVRAMYNGQSRVSQLMMRGRIVAQAATIGLMLAGSTLVDNPRESIQNSREKFERDFRKFQDKMNTKDGPDS
mmetsp:Transcript_16593/g.24394  ORF Transcript_16593/g.24394 Transcript_16593/m.24394 type:complete len:104 (-) Transcript_16593:65-376(-)|eukprot:CAMPEP_0113943594 /NCGR_PEP_ID=MMETSP1339-20121228/26784_1 /TAXON_ID=94617 /ORGANISM="Fibrocapsa japonica" /LENGTH=103 /DNA_ID=CAMNT_0000948503 /DNA_START=143 /DNA_END=454 /DNA_ORIENTATION=- /assembly_acc=CAM_ASM_000762